MPKPATRLRDTVRTSAENRPGVYRMLDDDDRVLYVGKSIRVRTRLMSYFRASPGEKAHELIQATSSIEWTYVPDEFGALVDEMRMIQRWRPRFNVQHKRRRRYAFAKLTREPAPRLMAVRRVVEDGSRYYGPFPAGRRVVEAVRDLAQVLGLRDCAGDTPVHFDDQPDMFGLLRSPLCLRAELGGCLGPCAGLTSSRRYMDRVRIAEAFLAGTSDEPFRLLDERMWEAARQREFEYASLLRDRRNRLQAFLDDATAFRGEVESLSFLYTPNGYERRGRVYLVRRGRVRRSLVRPRGRRDRERVARAVAAVYAPPEAGPAGLAPEEAAEIILVATWFRRNPEERRLTRSPRRWLSERADGAEAASVPRERPPHRHDALPLVRLDRLHGQT